jgi:spore maturation protein CgeB
MKILLVQPGASWSTADLYTGIVGAMQRQGEEVIQYALDKRITAFGEWLLWQWKRNKKKTDKPNGLDAIYLAGVGVIEKALYHNVDWVFIVAGSYMHPAFLTMLRRAHVKIAILFTECPYDDEWQLTFAPLADVCFVNDKVSVPAFRNVNRQTYYWQHAYDKYRHTVQNVQNEPEVMAHDVVFVGTGWIERIALFEQVDWTGIDLGLYGTWELASPDSPLRPYIHDAVTPNATTAALYRKAKIGINLHRTSVGYGKDTDKITIQPYSLGPRAYELAACGVFTISDWRPELNDVFGDVVPTFKTPEELGETIRFYLAHPDERKAIAAKLPDLVARHTFDTRVVDALEILERQGDENGTLSR